MYLVIQHTYPIPY